MEQVNGFLQPTNSMRNMWGNMRWVKKMGMENIVGKMEQFTRDFSRITKGKEKASSKIKKEKKFNIFGRMVSPSKNYD